MLIQVHILRFNVSSAGVCSAYLLKISASLFGADVPPHFWRVLVGVFGLLLGNRGHISLVLMQCVEGIPQMVVPPKNPKNAWFVRENPL